MKKWMICIAAGLGMMLPLPSIKAQVSQRTKSAPTLFIVGDSTAHVNGNAKKYGAKMRVGWGTPFPVYFNPTEIRVVNAAVAGRSSRTFMRDGYWKAVLQQLKSGDFVLI